MPRILKDLKINEVSSVDVGAGRGVKVLLMKRDDPLATNTGDVKMTDAELQALLKKSSEEAAAAATAAVTKVMGVELAKRDEAIAVLKMSPAHKSFFDGLKDDDAKKAFTAADDAKRDEMCAATKKRDDVATGADLAKRDGDIETLRKSNADLQKRLDAADLKEAQATFKKRAADLGLTEDNDGELMRKAYSGDADAQVAFEKRQTAVVKGLAEQVKTGKLFDTFGATVAKSGSAYAQLEAKRDELMKTEAGKNLTKEQAFAKVYEDPSNRATVELSKRENVVSVN